MGDPDEVLEGAGSAVESAGEEEEVATRVSGAAAALEGDGDGTESGGVTAAKAGSAVAVRNPNTILTLPTLPLPPPPEEEEGAEEEAAAAAEAFAFRCFFETA